MARSNMKRKRTGNRQKDAGNKKSRTPSRHASPSLQPFPDELLVSVGENIFHKPTQASLCRVSKRFQQIFTSVLYREICLDNVTEKSLVNLSNLPENSHLRFVKRLVLGISTVRLYLGARVAAGVATSSIMKIVPKLNPLRSFGYLSHSGYTRSWLMICRQAYRKYPLAHRGSSHP